ncbi:hypothetical protein HXX76_008250 [Chlamydomonas incerta]|uniref:Uncharacterized protein n=1 Tax=Chlamydomonas incerta TaxID=51695 RepID=A0A835SV37_CHLIN|nr:hypothetical protein HXX76_008250 [Chlamydomonas incerta]|eukprot:KAG2433897.1 hypothetical protein HXX76_008250 [Chlamydomonas incerta]
MCLSFFVLDAPQGPRFLLAFNRDEYFDSRGGITTAFLTGDTSPVAFAQSLDAANFHGFNLVLADLAGPAPSLVYTHNGVAATEEEPARGTAAGSGANGAGSASGGASGANGPGADGPSAACSSGQEEGVSAVAERSLAADALAAGVPAAGADPVAGVEVSLGQLAVAAAGHSSVPRAEAAKATGPEAPSPTPPDAGGADAGGAGEGSKVQQLKPGVVYGVSNGLLLEWPKVASGVAVLGRILPSVRQGEPVPWSRLFDELLGDDTRLVPPSGQVAAAEAEAEEAGAKEEQGAGNGAAAVSRALAADAAARSSGAGVHVDGKPGASAAAGAGHVRGSSGSSSGCSTGAGGAGVGGGVGGGAGDSYFVRELEHITSGRFVAEVDSPFGKYGTRSQTLMVVWPDGRVEMRERAREPDGSWRDSALDFTMRL